MFDTLFTLIDIITANNVSDMVVKLIAVITPLMASLVALYALYFVYQSLFDSQNLMVMETLKFMLSLCLVMTVALSTDFYLDKIVPIVNNSGQDITNALLSPPAGTTAGAVQLLVNKVHLQITTLWATIDIDILSGDSFAHAFLVIFQVIYLILGSVPFIAICTAYLVVAKIMVSLLLIIGPLFIMFSFFPSTRDFFKAWTAQCFNYILLSILFPIAFGLFGAVLDATVFSGTITLLSVFMSLIIFVILSYVAIQIPTLASSLSGGIGINGLVASVAGSIGTATRFISNSRSPKNSPPPPKPSGNNISAG